MNVRSVPTIIFCFILGCTVFLPVARAGEQDQMTKLTFAEPVEIPGAVLPAGVYWFVLQNSFDRNVVQIYSADWSEVEATLMTVPTERRQTTNYTAIEFAERPHDKPQALLKWYFPCRMTGHEFLYSSRHAKEFARDSKQDLLAGPDGLTIAQR